MREGHVGTDLQPLLHLVVHIQTSGITLHIRVVHNTTVLQVAGAGIVVQFVGHTAEADVVLLTERSVESLAESRMRMLAGNLGQQSAFCRYADMGSSAASGRRL